MSGEPQLFRVDPQSRESKRIEEVDFRQLGLQERQDIQEWVAVNPGILGDDLLIVGKEFRGFDRTDERLDLLGVDPDGKLVVIELKRDDTGADAHWQAIKYASYFRRASAEQIVGMLAGYKNVSTEDSEEELVQHLGGDDLNSLNNDQRIILASHRFAPEVTSAALWLNSKTPGEELITCVTLTPFRDADTGALYVQAATIIPVPGEEDYVIGIDTTSPHASSTGSSNFAANLKRTFQRHRNDEVTPFVKKVGKLALQELPVEVRPTKVGKWAAGRPDFRYYNLWYGKPPWRNHHVCYRVTLRPQDSDRWLAIVRFMDERKLTSQHLERAQIHENQETDDEGLFVKIGVETLNDDFAGRIADTLRQVIEHITPIVDNLEEESNEEEA
ncbi:MAG: endonuclease NucS [Chloroflexota bacterium]|nr:endonuclease NucS [Chloroflexota bacterium]MDE2940801.1 endonuclease NucS [Chloroflexota bacterium]MDE3268563.1 endonuclease NucS [Chloroflexota bacterium]